MRRRLQADDRDERDGSDSNCSDSVVGGSTGAFRPTAGSPKEGSTNAGTSYPSPNISVGPPIHPPPHLLPYLYPHGLYPPPPLSLLHNPAAAAAMNPGLLFNAQLALAAQHPALFGHYSGHSPTSPLHGLKGHRFSPYSLPSGLGSAFDAVTPGSNSGGPRSLSSSPRPRATSVSPTPTRPLSVSPGPTAQQPTPGSPPVTTANNNNNNNTARRSPQTTTNSLSNSSPSELKSIENMVNGLEVQHQLNGGGGDGDQTSSMSPPTKQTSSASSHDQ
jgi:T-box protein 2